MKKSTIFALIFTCFLPVLFLRCALDNVIKMHISIILVETESEARQLLEKLNTGADFADLAKQHSKVIGKEEGGDLVYFVPGDIMEELNATAVKLQDGQYSGIIKTAMGYFIIMKTDEKSAAEMEKIKEQEAKWGLLMQQAMQLYQQAKYAEAILSAKEALQLAENSFGKDNPNTAASLNNLAVLYRTQGNYAEVESLSKRALEIYEKALGPDHLGVAQSLDNLAELYRTQGNYAKAEPLYKRALETHEKVLGPDHPDVATVLENMANLYKSMGKIEETARFEKRAKEIRLKNQ